MTDTGKHPSTPSVYDERKEFAFKWRQFLRENFRTIEQVRRQFAVDESTARSWWAGITAPQGWAVASAFKHYPDEADAILIERPPVVIEFRSRIAHADAGSEATPDTGSPPCTDNAKSGVAA